MKICFLAPFNPIASEETMRGGHMGGVERYSECVVKELAAQGVDVTLVCTGEENRETEQHGVRVVQKKRLGILLRTPIAWVHGEFRKDFDLFHVPATYPTYSEVLPVMAKLQRTPCLLDYHFDVPPTGLATRVLAPVYYALARRTFALADRVIVKSEGYDEISPGLRRVPSERLSFIPNGVDTDFYSPTPNPTRDYFLFVGRLVPYKGTHVLLDALSKLPKDARLPLRIVGSGPEDESLRRQARALGVDVEFKGYVSNEELREQYRNACATLLPSITNQESFGMTLVESMACGTPVVASALIGTRYVQRFGGDIVPPGDADALADVLSRRARGDAKGPMGPALALRAHEAFAWQNVATQVRRLYEDVLENGTTDRRSALAFRARRRPAAAREQSGGKL